MKPLFFSILLPLSIFSQQPNCDIIIRNGKIIDGSGNSWYYGDIAVKDGRIVAVGRQLNYDGKKTIDATGLIVAPGFIDLHAHGQNVPSNTYQLMDGVTTALELEMGTYPLDVVKSREGHSLLNYG